MYSLLLLVLVSGGSPFNENNFDFDYPEKNARKATTVFFP
jgi:hypothetical protein